MIADRLPYGLADEVPIDARAAWGARLIINMDGHVDLVPDRQGGIGEPDDRSELLAELNARFPHADMVNRIRDGLRRYEFTTRTDERVTLFEDDTIMFVANPNGSCGYLYVAAWFKVTP